MTADQFFDEVNNANIPFGYQMHFQSDLGSPLGLCADFGGCVIVEDGTIQTLGTIIWSDGTVDTVLFRSDVAEPGSLALLGFGLAGLAALRRRVRM